MTFRQPRGDKSPLASRAQSLDAAWDRVLGYRRGDGSAHAAAQRLMGAGVTPDLLARVLGDGGDGLFRAWASDEDGWADAYGGQLAVALLAAEVSAVAAHLSSRASAIRSRAVQELLQDYSAISVSAELGVSRQKVYELARPTEQGTYIDHTPWSHS